MNFYYCTIDYTFIDCARKKCMNMRDTQRCLADCLKGEVVQVSRFTGGRMVESRLRSMGLTVGNSMTVLNNAGPFIVAMGTSRIVLGAGLAEKITVTTG